MKSDSIIDWSDAFDNSSYVPGSSEIVEAWGAAAEAFRDAARAAKSLQEDIAYGAGERHRMDLFRPNTSRGLLIFVHGGYWQWLSNKSFSHLAAGALAQDWSVAMPTLST